MLEAVVPFLLYLVLQVTVLLSGMAVTKPERSVKGLIRTYIFHASLDQLYWAFLAAAVMLAGLGGYRFLKNRRTWNREIPEKGEKMTPFAWVLLILAALVILAQFGLYLLGIHVDEDDSRWLAEANDALESGEMIYHQYSTGAYWNWVYMPKDAVSPWPIFFAILSRLTFGTRVTILAHTVFASMELPVMYGVYYLLGCELFRKKESRFMFLLMVSVINLYYAGTVYTQSVFSLVRIWQGKAVVAAVIIPLLLYLFVRINKENRTEDWLLLGITDAAACLVSGMGISIAAIMILGYGAYHVIAYRSWKRIPLLLLGVVPSALFTPLYLFYNQVADFILLGK